MRLQHLGLALLLGSVSLQPQTTTDKILKNPAAVQIVESALAASGGRSVLQSVRDFRETGTITYNWGLAPLEGTATISALAGTDFRFDASLPGQDRSWFVTRGQGKSRLNNKTSSLPLHTGVNRSALTLPVFHLVNVSYDPKYRLSYIGTESRDGQDLHHLRFERVPEKSDDYEKEIAQLETVEYFVDPHTFLIVRTEDVAHPPENMSVNQRHLIEYSDYRAVDGLQVPFSVTEHLGNAQTWSLQLNEVKINSGLTSSDIQF